MEQGTLHRSNSCTLRQPRPRGLILCYNSFVILATGLLLVLSNGVVVDEFSAHVRQQKDSAKSADKRQHHSLPGIVSQTETTDGPEKHFKSSHTKKDKHGVDPLKLSKRHQRKFDQQKGLLETSFTKSTRYYVDLFEFGANIVNDEYAYIHIFKNGGTTIEVQTGHDHTSIWDPQVQKRKWFTFVRDPIDHFLSGWAECFHRMRVADNYTVTIPENTSVEESYDQRVNEWIDAVTAMARTDIKAACEIHSFPQVNSLLDPHGRIPRQLKIVGDLFELPAILAHIGFDYNPSIESGRNATANPYLQTYFPKRKDWLTYKTKRRLCRFLVMDYFLFDFEMPPACSKGIVKSRKEDIAPTIDTDQIGIHDMGRELTSPGQVPLDE